jgi:hypothetical protein
MAIEIRILTTLGDLEAAQQLVKSRPTMTPLSFGNRGETPGGGLIFL